MASKIISKGDKNQSNCLSCLLLTAVTQNFCLNHVTILTRFRIYKSGMIGRQVGKWQNSKQ